MTTTTLAINDLHTFTTREGYKLCQHRPMECRLSCTCGRCNGRVRSAVLPVASVVHWADNSIEAFSIPDATGRVWIERLEYPKGDLCF